MQFHRRTIAHIPVMNKASEECVAHSLLCTCNCLQSFPRQLHAITTHPVLPNKNMIACRSYAICLISHQHCARVIHMQTAPSHENIHCNAIHCALNEAAARIICQLQTGTIALCTCVCIARLFWAGRRDDEVIRRGIVGHRPRWAHNSIDLNKRCYELHNDDITT